MWSQLKDMEFKHKFKASFDIKCANHGFGSDIEYKIGDTYVLIEYENSSRGMLSNLARVYRRFKIKQPKYLVLIYLRTDIHIQRFKNDKENTHNFADLIGQSEGDKFCVKTFAAADYLEWSEYLKSLNKKAEK